MRGEKTKEFQSSREQADPVARLLPRWGYHASWLLLSSLWLGATPLAWAETTGPLPSQAGPEAVAHAHRHDVPADEEGLHDHRHHLMLMAAPGVGDGAGGFFSGGVGYEYRLPFLHDLLGVGAMAELMFMSGHHPHQMLMASAWLHPLGGLYLQTSIGASHAHDQSRAASGSRGRMSTKAVFRLSAGYDFHVGSVMISPHLNADAGSSSTRAISAGLCLGFML